MVTKYDYTKDWNELTNEEQTSWDAKCQKSETKKIKDFARINNIDFDKLTHLCVVDSVKLWDDKHIKTLRDNVAKKYKPLLKEAVTLEEYNRLFKECSDEMAEIGL